MKIKRNPSILETAQALVTGDRAAAYGPPEENFARWRDMIRATGRPGLENITAEDLCIVMILLKVARESGSPVRDTPVDIAGYAYCLDRVRGL